MADDRVLDGGAGVTQANARIVSLATQRCELASIFHDDINWEIFNRMLLQFLMTLVYRKRIISGTQWVGG